MYGIKIGLNPMPGSTASRRKKLATGSFFLMHYTKKKPKAVFSRPLRQEAISQHNPHPKASLEKYVGMWVTESHHRNNRAPTQCYSVRIATTTRKS